MAAPREFDTFLLVSGRGVDVEKLVDERFLRVLLAELPTCIGMRPLQPPTVLVADNNPGLEGYVPIDESNITISTYTRDPRFVAAIHSCRDFPADVVLARLRERFGASQVSARYIRESEFTAAVIV